MGQAFQPDAVHIATEGPLDWAVRRWCQRTRRPFTTSFHTRFPEYLRARTGLPEALGYAVLRRFHRTAATTMAATLRLAAELETRGFARVRVWGRGVDTSLFRPRPRQPNPDHPLWLTVGRVAVEKNLEAFLALDLPGRKMVVGDGPAREILRRRDPDVEFPGARAGLDLARTYAEADVFVFPSRTDTFGNVMLEALACGVPVAAYPVPSVKRSVGLQVWAPKVFSAEGVQSSGASCSCSAALASDRFLGVLDQQAPCPLWGVGDYVL